MFQNTNRYIYTCDLCGKTLNPNEMVNHGNRYVGMDGDLMIELSIAEEPVYNRGGRRQRTILLCPKCWAKVFRAVRRVLKLEEKAAGEK